LDIKGGKALIETSDYEKRIKVDRYRDIDFNGSKLIIENKVFVRGDIFISPGSVFVCPGSTIKGNIHANTSVVVERGAMVYGCIESFSVENRGEIKGNIEANNFVSYMGKSEGNINAKFVLIAEHAVHIGLINAMCKKIHEQGRHLGT